jgi:hypothetical protein
MSALRIGFTARCGNSSAAMSIFTGTDMVQINLENPAAPMFLAGSSVKPGLHGTHPEGLWQIRRNDNRAATHCGAGFRPASRPR